ncbi:uncharacterized protein ASCRUDRAFT_7127 [Ascoidea rubescens DSM 1968]|uniref:Uncharacterized protein n=1 Tax=Ascoidea rubescens DSM 1968 TaxID=1344418 RepID=A0A1D2VLT7_9ASCO|nr:hypothetical protein ASCRUDRAFT_7127 [Ascoidea rubescens DSM 1968]ODV62578.1 hypothetical protein ASCRUDRAFT_7127 [Ascoidea rubescens DSM 1968]
MLILILLIHIDFSLIQYAIKSSFIKFNKLANKMNELAKIQPNAYFKNLNVTPTVKGSYYDALKFNNFEFDDSDSNDDEFDNRIIVESEIYFSKIKYQREFNQDDWLSTI